MRRWVFAAAVSLLALTACGPPTVRVPPGSSGPEQVEGGVVFRYVSTSARSVHVVGDFNGWNPGIDALTDDNGDGEWALFYPLEPGRYAYKFVIDGKRWISDPTNPRHEPDGFGDINSVVEIGTGPGAPTPKTR